MLWTIIYITVNFSFILSALIQQSLLLATGLFLKSILTGCALKLYAWSDHFCIGSNFRAIIKFLHSASSTSTYAVEIPDSILSHKQVVVTIMIKLLYSSQNRFIHNTLQSAIKNRVVVKLEKNYDLLCFYYEKIFSVYFLVLW